ncbi:cell division protein FtsK, partial [Pontimonas sp.]|nr:cell division protein FtsK [Pontimonas sp.]
MATKSPASGARKPAPTKRSPSAPAPTKRVPRSQVVAPQATGGPSAVTTGWLVVAGWVGSAFRFLSSRELPKEDRRDGVPFALVLFALIGVIVEWFNYNQAWARALDYYTVGGFFGRLAFALPVIVLVFAAWLFRNPSSVYPNGRVGVGLGLLLTSVSGMTHLASGRPAPGEATFEQLASGGGLLGWVVAEPFVFLANSTVFVAWPVMVVFFLISVLIMTKTP